MKFLTVVSLIFSASVSAWATTQVTQFRCRTTDAFMGRSVHNFTFRVENLNRPSADISYAYLDSKAEDNDEVVRVTAPEGSSIRTLNDNWGIKRTSDGIQMTGDGDGCEYVQFHLYSNEYRRGYIRVDGDTGCGNGSGYSRVSCTHREIRP